MARRDQGGSMVKRRARALSDFRLQITQPNRLRISPRACARVKAIRVARALLSASIAGS